MKTRVAELDNKKIIIVDDIVPTGEIEDFFTYVNGLSFYKHERDDEMDEYPIFSVDFTPEVFESDTFIGEKAKELLLANYNGNYRLKRSYINMSCYGDIEFPHYDCGSDEKDITVLYYVNHKWDYRWGGETLFYSNQDTRITVLPKPGRFVLFPGNIEHTGTVPTRICKIPRYSLALKYELAI
ncbi:FlmC family 2OG-Fe(II) oxygenase [Sinomicrobium oceani]|uniref:2OG-Fe(II) oxygenase n=1 Tax=Sinomicrobium oceani TaxID=1150368 RepID=UPI00227A28B0|nr:2OG-Fe(II) oxygenase [Sinomicrobium oceani]